MNRTRILVAGCALLAAAGATAQITKSGAGYLFRARYAKGRTVRYLADSYVKAPGLVATPTKGQVRFSMSIASRVVDVRNKIATVQVTVSPLRTAASRAIPSNSTRTVTIRVDDRNRPVGDAGANIVGATFPAGPVRVGQSWTAAYPVPMGGQATQKMKTTYKLVGFKQFKGVRAAILAITVSGAGRGSGTALVSTADGQALSTSLTLSMNAPGQGPVTMRLNVRRA